MEQYNSKVAQLVIEKLKHVTPVVQGVLDKAVTEARTFFENKRLPVDPFLFPCLVRYEAKTLFESIKYQAIGYRFVVLSNNGLLLIYEYQGCIYRIRVRKADEDGELPKQNLSRTLREFYTQPTPFLPGMSFEELEDYICPESLKLVVVWDVDYNHVLKDVNLVCPKGESGTVHFIGKIEHAATSIYADDEFDEEPDEIDEIDLDVGEKRATNDND